MQYKEVAGGICAPKGFAAAGVHCGIRANHSEKYDLALIKAEVRCAAAGVYTTNKVCGAPIKVDRAHLTDGYAQAILVNSGNANTCAANGVALAEECCELVGKALNIPAEDTKKLVPQIAEFMKQRLRNMLMDQGIRYDVVDAVLADQMNDDFTDLVARAKALNSFVASAEAPALIQAATRVANLCKKIEEESAINPQLFAVEAEGALHNAAMAASKEVLVAATKYDYAAVMAEAVKLVDPINKFFEDVMVMDEDVRVKNNRLALLAAVKDITHAVGDLSVIVQ